MRSNSACSFSTSSLGAVFARVARISIVMWRLARSEAIAFRASSSASSALFCASSQSGFGSLMGKAEEGGGERGIRTLDTGLSPYNALAGRPLRPLGHLSGEAELYPDGGL